MARAAKPRGNKRSERNGSSIESLSQSAPGGNPGLYAAADFPGLSLHSLLIFQCSVDVALHVPLFDHFAFVYLLLSAREGDFEL